MLLLLTLENGSLKSQGWAPLGATWYYSYDSFWVTGYVKIVSLADTNFNGRNYRILEKSYHTYDYLSLIYKDTVFGYEYVYTDSNRLYIFRNHNNYILYDMSQGPGGSWVIPATFPVCDSTGEVEVDVISSATINGSMYKTMTVNSKDSSHWGWGGGSPTIIIDKIGNTGAYFLPDITFYCGVVDIFEGGPLRCYHDNSMGWFYTYIQDECDYINYTGEYNEAGFAIYPNPARDFLWIGVPSTLKVISYEIMNLSGLAVKPKQSCSRYSEIMIPVDNLKPGLYFIKLSGEEQDNYYLRFMKT